MAQKIQTIFIDDIDGGSADGTVLFELDGTQYEIDLSSTHSEALRKVLDTYILHGRKVPGATRRSTLRAGRRNTGTPETSKIREWAKAQGIGIKDRGRVPGDIVAKYRAATGR